ncbi:MAG: hypothetical protein Aurels2KO_45210 [Aureliella sp.]
MVDKEQANTTSEARVAALQLRIAADVAQRTWQRPLREFARLIESGCGVEHCPDQCDAKIPQGLRSAVLAALQTPAPIDIIVAASNSNRKTVDLRRSVLHMLAYPCALLTLCMLAASVIAAVIEQVVWVESGVYFFQSELSSEERAVVDQIYAIYFLTGLVCWTLSACWVLRLALPAWAWHAFQCGLPIVGRVYGWLAISELLERLSLFAELDETVAYDRLADSFAFTGLHRAALHLQRSVSNGVRPDEAVARCLLLHEKSSAVASLLIAQAPSAESYRSVAETLRLAAEKATSSWRGTLPIVTWALTGTLIIATFAMMLRVTLSLLSGYRFWGFF